MAVAGPVVPGITAGGEQGGGGARALVALGVREAGATCACVRFAPGNPRSTMVRSSARESGRSNDGEVVSGGQSSSSTAAIHGELGGGERCSGD